MSEVEKLKLKNSRSTLDTTTTQECTSRGSKFFCMNNLKVWTRQKLERSTNNYLVSYDLKNQQIVHYFIDFTVVVNSTD